MTSKQRLYLSVAAIGTFALLAGAPVQLSAQTAAQSTVAIDDNDIGGVVTGANGPEAGVWVIAETSELPTKYAKMVVTDDLGRYVIPDLPTANYSVWVRGYGLVDSPKLRAKPSQHLDLKAVPAPNETEAAHYYPAIATSAARRSSISASGLIASPKASCPKASRRARRAWSATWS